MPKLFRTITAAALLAITGLASASAVYAEQNPAPDTRDSHMGTGMQPGGMMGTQGGMMGQMSQMMAGCNNMMQSQNQSPNSQFQHPPKPPQEE
jgi:hypothetical protein